MGEAMATISVEARMIGKRKAEGMKCCKGR